MADNRQQGKAKDIRSADQIRRDIAAARAKMSATVEGLTEQFHPAAVKKRVVEDAKEFVQKEYTSVREKLISQVKDEDGWRTDRLKLVGGASAGAVTGLVLLRAVVGKVTGSTARKKFEKAQVAAAKDAKKQAKKQRKTDAKAAKTAKKQAKKLAKTIAK